MRNCVRELALREYRNQCDRAPEFVVMFVPHEATESLESRLLATARRFKELGARTDDLRYMDTCIQLLAIQDKAES
jgi:DNA anti-recombination protein RmuC